VKSVVIARKSRSILVLDPLMPFLTRSLPHRQTDRHTNRHTHTQSHQSIDFVEPEYSLLCSNVPAGGSCPVPGVLVNRLTPQFVWFFILCYLRLCFPVLRICRHSFALRIIIDHILIIY
jgi:hypothetical protein